MLRVYKSPWLLIINFTGVIEMPSFNSYLTNKAHFNAQLSDLLLIFPQFYGFLDSTEIQC